MDKFLRLGAYIFHPLLMPLLGVVLYYIFTPRFLDPKFVQAKILAVLILTFLIPLILFFLLRSLKVVSSIHLREVSERRIPLMIQSLLLVLIIKIVFNAYDTPELYYFFIGILFSSITALVLVLFKLKISLHQMGVAGVTMFLVALSVHFKINMLLWVSVLLIINGWVASSRLHTKSHTSTEIIIGFFVGVIPQLFVLNLWL